MQNKKLTPSWLIAGTVAAVLAVSTAPVHAQGTGASGGMSPMSGGMSSGMMDYHLLNSPLYDYVDLMQAKARGLSDSQIATIAKIAKLTDMSFPMVAAMVERGETFPSIAVHNNLKLADVYENDKEKQEISDYTSLYESVGTMHGSGGMMGMGGMSGGGMSGGGMSGGGMSGGGMSGGMTTPAPTQ